MTDDTKEGGLQFDSDWKEEAAREKEELIKKEKQEQAQAEQSAAGSAEASFVELVNLIAMQAAIGLGGMKAPSGETVPPNPAAAKQFIDLLEVLQKKTKGNLVEEEEKILNGVLYELQMQFVQAVSTQAPPPTEGAVQA